MTRFLFRLALALAVFAALPALAADREKLTVTLVNTTPLEVVHATIKAGGPQGEGWRMSSTVTIVPGNACEFGFGGASGAREIILDMGLAVFTFPDLSPFSERSDLTLVIGLEDGAIPYLELKEEGRTPVRVKGSMRPLVSEALLAHAVDLDDVIEAENMGQVRTLAAKALAAADDPSGSERTDDKKLVFPVRGFGDCWWVAEVEPQDEESIFYSYDEKSAGVGDIFLRTRLEEGVLQRVLEDLLQRGYLPWFLQFKQGADMDMVRAVKFHAEEPDMEASWEQLRDMFFSLMPKDGSAAAIDALLIPDQHYAEAIAGGKLPPLPGLRVHVSNSQMLQVRLLRDCGLLLDMTR